MQGPTPLQQTQNFGAVPSPSKRGIHVNPLEHGTESGERFCEHHRAMGIHSDARPDVAEGARSRGEHGASPFERRKCVLQGSRIGTFAEFLLPQHSGPEIKTVNLSDQDRIALQACGFAQQRGQENAALLVHLNIHGIANENATGQIGVHTIGHRLDIGSDAMKRWGGINLDARLIRAREVELRSALLGNLRAKPCRDRQTSLVING